MLDAVARLIAAHEAWLRRHLDAATDTEEHLYHYDAFACLVRFHRDPNTRWDADYDATHGPGAQRRVAGMVRDWSADGGR